ncbi:unnamed protein product [Hermetia illucens]|uniref:Uncharacterized protein n=1 Tax=Hermetia illucens TaxID=343691 RepID=A0A7R8YXU7_HERIL|nr:uncharacterized protein LOC119655071 [Hermetia illucens]CAD7088850.1 unnamed protein product [Hermetia illucens]
MWNAMARQRNSYLHATLKTESIDPYVLNKCVEIAMHKEKDIKVERADFHQPTLIQPKRFGINPIKKNANLAYGLDGIPQLLKDLASYDLGVQSKALHSLEEELQNSYKCYRAIVEFNIASRLNQSLDNFFPLVPGDISPLLKNIVCIGLVASHYQGAKALMHEHNLISNLYDMIIDTNPVSRNAALALYRMSSQPEVADVMASGDHLQRAVRVLERIDHIEEVYMVIANLIERSPGKAMSKGVFETIYCKLNRCHEYPTVMKCLALLINCREAEEVCDKKDIVYKFKEMLADDSLPLKTLEYLSLGICNALYTTTAMWRCREFWDLPAILIKRAHNKTSDFMQLWCLQALRQLIMMPSIKNLVRKTYKKKIKNIVCRKDYVEKVKNDLLKQLRTKPYLVAESDEEKEESESDTDHITAGPHVSRGPDIQKAKFDKEDFPPPIAYRLDYRPLKNYDINNRIQSDSERNSKDITDEDMDQFVDHEVNQFGI